MMNSLTLTPCCVSNRKHLDSEFTLCSAVKFLNLTLHFMSNILTLKPFWVSYGEQPALVSLCVSYSKHPDLDVMLCVQR